MILTIANYAGAVSSVIGLIVILIKPLRNRALGLGKVMSAQRCSLRSDMLRIYYACREEKKIRQYALENFLMMYEAYKALKGNSFVDRIKEEVITWEVVS